MFFLTDYEKRIKDKFLLLKNQSGTHSPSIETLRNTIPEIKIHIDACFLSNPYATELFLKYVDKELIKSRQLREFLEYYPSQNNIIAEKIGSVLDINPK